MVPAARNPDWGQVCKTASELQSRAMTDKKRKLPSWLTDKSEETETGNIQNEETRTQRALAAETSPNAIDGNVTEEEDYLNMTFDSVDHISSLTSQRARKLREKQERGKNGPGSDLSRTIDAATKAKGMHKSLLVGDSSQPPSKAMKMMQKMGYSSGQALGPDSRGIIEPLIATEHIDRGGLGLANQQKREVLQKIETSARQVQEEQTEYRQTVRSENDEKRLEGRIHAAQKICETLDTQVLEERALQAGRMLTSEVTHPEPKDINVLWRSLVVVRRERERERALRQQMLDSSMSFSDRQYNEDLPHASSQDAAAALRKTVYEEDSEDEDDQELIDFEALDAEERLQLILVYLRTTYFYCFWCGCKYTDREDLENCPGLAEVDHE